MSRKIVVFSLCIYQNRYLTIDRESGLSKDVKIDCCEVTYMEMKRDGSLRVNGANVLTGVDKDGRYAVHAGRKGETYHVLSVNPPSPEEIVYRLSES